MALFYLAHLHFLIWLIITSLTQVDAQQKHEVKNRIILAPSMIINEKALGNANALLDEQNISENKTPTSIWDPGWIDPNYYPLSAVIDLGKEYNVTEISLFDGKETGNVIIQSGMPFHWEEIFTYNQDEQNIWVTKPINKKTRFIRLEMESRAFPYEIRLYGNPIKANQRNDSQAPSKLPKPTMDKLIGVNAFIDDPIDKIQVASFVREYHNWRWDASDIKYPNNQHAWNPSNAGGGWNFDKFYSTLSQLGIDVVPCLKGNANWIPGKMEDKPILFDKNSTNPSAYIAHADYLYQYVARYGNEKKNRQELKLKGNQLPKSGLNLIHYIENWNEQNKTWEGVNAYFTPFEYAAMASADYDAHQGSIEGNLSIKKADPNFKMVMGGLAGLDLEYIKSIKFWADYNRNGSIPFDVINLHFYSRNKNHGISPEEDSIRQKLEKIVVYRNEFMPNQEIWITEFGYDTHPNSPQRALAIKDLSREEVQAQWLVRSYLEIAAAGIDRAAMYMLRDVDPKSSTKYATSGLTSDQQSGWKPKPSWFYIYTLKNVLKDMAFVESTNRKGVNIYKFKNHTTNKTGLVVWSPTSEAKVINDFKLKVDEGIKKVTKISLQDGNINGISDFLNVTNHFITLTVTETPIFIMMDNNKK